MVTSELVLDRAAPVAKMDTTVVGSLRQVTVDADAALYEELRVWRAEVADVAGIPVFMILTNRQLRDIVRLRPASLAALGGISGIGQARLQTYGRVLLDRIRGGANNCACFCACATTGDCLRRKAMSTGCGRFSKPGAWWAGGSGRGSRLPRPDRSRVPRPGPSRRFVIHDPKEREITAAPFRDRVVHHAVCAAVGPVLERAAIEHSYACRPGKGMHAACQSATSPASASPTSSSPGSIMAHVEMGGSPGLRHAISVGQ